MPGGIDRTEQAELAQALKEIIFLERELESSKIDLALKSDFNLMDAFRLFDSRGYNFLSAEDLVHGLHNALDFTQFSQDDIYLLLRRADRLGRGRIDFHEFGEVFLPHSQEYAALVTDRPDYYIRRGCDVAHFFTCETR